MTKQKMSSFSLVSKIIVISIFWARPVAAETAPEAFIEKNTKVLGRKTGGRVVGRFDPAAQSLSTLAGLNVFGVALQALSAWMSPPNTINGVTYNEVFVFGKKIFTQNGKVNMDWQNLKFSAGLAPTEARIPILTYPLGPVLLKLDAGARLQADLTAAITPNYTLPDMVGSMNMNIGARVAAAGFAEGYVQVLIVRGGVGGQVDLVDAKADVYARVGFDGTPPVFLFSAMAQFLKGRFYAFLDIFTIIPFSFKRLIDHELYRWKGYCISTGQVQCPSK